MNLKTTYMGIPLRNPLVTAASPLSKWLDGMKRMEDSGAGAVTMFSLFEEQIEHEMRLVGEFLDYGADSYAEATRYLPEPEAYHRGPDEYLELIRDAREVLEIPVIASLNGSSRGGWIEYAKQIEQAGANALEMNIYWVETDTAVTGTEVERRYLDLVNAVCQEVTIPVAVKIGPYFSSVANMALGFEANGASGLVLFNRFYQPDFDLASFEVKPSLSWSTSQEMRLPLHWAAILYGQTNIDVAISSGVSNGFDVVKGLLAGAQVVTFASCLMQNGVGYLARILGDLENWLTSHGYESVDELRGVMSHRRVADASAFERGNYMKELQSFRPDRALLR